MPESYEKTIIKMYEDAGFSSSQAKAIHRSLTSLLSTFEQMVNDKLKPLQRRVGDLEESMEQVDEWIQSKKDQLI